LALALLAGCVATDARPMSTPPIAVKLSYYQGTLASGPTAAVEASARSVETALALEFSLFYLERWPDEALAPLPEQAVRVLSSRSDELLRATPQLGRDARIGIDDAALALFADAKAPVFGRAALLAHEVGALSPGVTAVFNALSTRDLAVSGEGNVRRSFALQLSRATTPADGELRVAVVLEDVAELGSEPGQRGLEREHVVLDTAPRVDGPPLALGLPLGKPEHGGFALFVWLHSPPVEGSAATEHRSAFDAAEGELGLAAQQTGALAREMPQSDLYRREVDGVFQAFDLERYHRSALVFLAGSTGARLAQDIALVAEDGLVKSYAKTVSEQSREAKLSAEDAPGVGWLLERSAYLFLSALNEKDSLPKELRACLLINAGELGRSPASLVNVVGSCKDLASFKARVLEENWIFLEDAQMPPRVRAFDWLKSRGQPLADFDPLGTREERRASLRRAHDALDQLSKPR
jgi:hypothetical protein